MAKKFPENGLDKIRFWANQTGTGQITDASSTRPVMPRGCFLIVSQETFDDFLASRGTLQASSREVAVKTVAYLDRDIPDARTFWSSVVLPDVEDFKSEPSEVRLGLHVAWSLWHLHDWLWHDENPGVDTKGNKEYEKFKEALIGECAELGWLRDLADAAKHRGLGRGSVRVEQIAEKLGRGGVGGLNACGGYGVGGIAPSAQSSCWWMEPTTGGRT
jgi:hypothetical protein